MLALGALMAVSDLAIAKQSGDKLQSKGTAVEQAKDSVLVKNTKKPVFITDSLYAAPEDARGDDGQRLRLTFSAAIHYAKQMNEKKYLGFDDWRVPTDKELETLIDNKDNPGLKGTFNELSGTQDAWYRTAPKVDYSDFVSYRRPRDGESTLGVKTIRVSVRLVRGSIN